MTTGAAREKDQADFDLERFIDMFDEALTSKDERVVSALRSLMMMTILTKSETYGTPARDRTHGPLRRLYEDLGHLNSRLSRAEEEIHQLQRPVPSYASENESFAKYDPWNKAMGPIGVFGPGAVGSPRQALNQSSGSALHEAINKSNLKPINPLKTLKEK